jgi:WD40 repeat protein
MLTGATDTVGAIVFSAMGDPLAAGSDDGTIRYYGIFSG